LLVVLSTAYSLAKKSYSSAYVLARDIPDRLDDVPTEAAHSYVTDSNSLINTIGIRAVGFTLDTLPRLYKKYGIEHTHRFVESIVSVAEAYGVTAAEWFYERRTRSAADVLAA
jgi:hypothetical protein